MVAAVPDKSGSSVETITNLYFGICKHNIDVETKGQNA